MVPDLLNKRSGPAHVHFHRRLFQVNYKSAGSAGSRRSRAAGAWQASRIWSGRRPSGRGAGGSGGGRPPAGKIVRAVGPAAERASPPLVVRAFSVRATIAGGTHVAQGREG